MGEEEKEKEGEEEKEDPGERKGGKLVTRKQKRDRRIRMWEEKKKGRLAKLKKTEQEVMRLKSIRKELTVAEKETSGRQEKKKEKELEKKMGPGKLSNYKYEDQELEVKLSDELTG